MCNLDVIWTLEQLGDFMSFYETKQKIVVICDELKSVEHNMFRVFFRNNSQRCIS